MPALGLYQRFTFFLEARNQYGVHSPFVYKYLTQCLYRKPAFSGPQYWRILKKSLPYFQHPPLWVLGKSIPFPENSLGAEILPVGTFPNPSGPYFLLITSNETRLEDLKNFPLSENCIWVFPNIRDPQAAAIWNPLKNGEVFQLALEFSQCGLLVVRPGQQKEHFKLRF